MLTQGLLWLAREIASAADREREQDEDEIKERLREIYLALEAGHLSEEEFAAEESALLDKLDALALERAPSEDEGEMYGADEGQEDGVG